jgi:PAS domain S-box-containing protein
MGKSSTNHMPTDIDTAIMPEPVAIALSVLPYPALLSDRPGIILEANQSMLVLFEADRPDQLIGKNLFSLLTPEPAAGKAFDFNGNLHFETEATTFKGNLRILEISRVQLAGPAREVDCVLGFIHDVTQERRAQRARDLLAAIVNSPSDAIVSISLDRTITSWNQGAEKLFGLTPAEVIGQAITIMVPPERHGQANAMIEEIRVNPGRVISFEGPAQAKDGHRVEISTTVFGVLDNSGKLLGVSGIMRDISGRRMVDREQALLAAIVESSDAAIISLAADSRILTWNAAAEKLFGYTAEEAIGQLPAKVFARGGDTERAVADFLKSVETFRHGGATARYFERTVQHKDGFFVDASFITSGIYDANAQLCGVSMIIRDISERKHKERDLARLAALVESSDDAISSISTDFRITSWNRSAEKLFGVTAQEAIGQSLEMLLVPDKREQVRRNMAQDMAALRERGNFVRRLETSVPRKDGTSAAVSLVVSGIFDRDGSVVGMSQSFRDITGLKRAEDELVTLASIVNTSGDAIISVSTDLKITSWNAAAEKVYGLTAQEAIGEGLELFVPPAELVQTIEVCRRVLETGQPASWEQHLQRADDTSVVSSVNIFVTRDAIGRIVGISGIGRDITKLKQIEKEVREAHEYTRGLIESSVDAMVMVDGGMRIMDGNEQLARLLKLPRKVLLGSPFESYFTEPAAAHEALKKVFADGMVTNVDLVVKAADGKEIPFHLTLRYFTGQARFLAYSAWPEM